MTKTTEELIDALNKRAELLTSQDMMPELAGALESNAQFIQQLQQRNAELERERDELAAHLERADRCIEYTSTYLNEDKLNAIGSGSKAHQEMRDYLHKTPKTTLAEHDAEVAIKTLENLVKENSSDSFSASIAIQMAKRKIEQLRNGKDGG